MKETDLIDVARKALRQYGLTVVTQRRPRAAGNIRADAYLRVGKNNLANEYVVEAKHTLTPAMLGAAATQARHMAKGTGRQPLLIAGHITPPMAEQLKDLGQQFVDAAGNAYLKGKGLLVWVVGRKPPDLTNADRNQTGGAIKTAGLKTLFALICDPELAKAPYRKIAAAANVALGALPHALDDLRQHGYLTVVGRHRHLVCTRRRLDDWALMYARTLRPKLLLKTLIAPDFDDWENWQLPQEVKWGGEPAANLLVGFLRPGALTLYAREAPARLIVDHRLRNAEPNTVAHLVEVRKRFWGELVQADAPTNIVPAALVYADLLATGDGRCIDTAELAYDQHLARLFPAA